MILSGGPLNAILSEIYMQHYATNDNANNSVHSLYVRTYFRYVDETFILFRGS